MLGDIQYVTDTFIIERTWKTIAALENSNNLNKTAFDLGSILEGLGSSVKQFIGGQIHGKDSGGVTRTILDFLIPATFFRIHPLLGIAVTAAQLLGFDLYSIYGKIVNDIKPKLEEGKAISPDEINSAASSAMTIIPDEDIPDNTVTSSQDYFYFLREAEFKGYFNKTAGPLSTEWKTHPLLPKQTDNILIRMFGRFGKRKVANIVVGILVWFLKTVLLSAGLLAVGGIALNALTNKKPEISTEQKDGIIPAVFKSAPKSTGAGSKLYKTNPGDLWIESLYGDDPEERILEWTLQSYPDLNQYQDIIVRTPSFQNTVNKIKENYRPGQQQISIPDPYKKKDDVLNEFIGDVYKNIKAPK